MKIGKVASGTIAPGGPVIDVPCIVVSQPIGTFYLAPMSAADLLMRVDILRRGMSDDQRKNIQRKLSENRRHEIAEYVSDPDATFPTSIIVSAYDGAVEYDESRRILKMKSGTIGKVLDGQHRLEGISLAINRGAVGEAQDFELPVVFMLGLEPEDEAYVFSIINSKQSPVQSSLIFDLFDLRKTRSPRKTCHDLAQALNAREGGPFYRGIKMLGTKNFDSEYLSQGTFAKELLKLITKRPDEYERAEKSNVPVQPDPDCPFNALYIQQNDAMIGKILENYFSAVASVFSDEWSANPEKFVLRKAVGYTALMMVLKEIWNKEISKTHDATERNFHRIALVLKEGVASIALTGANFASSGAGAGELARTLLRRYVPEGATSES